MTDQLLEELPALANPAEYPMYQVNSLSEILTELKSMVGNERNLVGIVFNDGVDAFRSGVLEILNNLDVIFAAAKDETVNRALLAAPDPVCIAQGGRNVQFALTDLDLGERNGRRVLRASMPNQILSMPRRDFFRVVLPITGPLKCQMPVGQGEEKGVVTVDVVDISGGGLSFNVPKGQKFVNGQDYPGCILDLPGVGKVTVTLHVCNQFTVSRRSFGKQLRAGCRYGQIAGAVLAQIERFVMQKELEKKARETGLGASGGVRASANTPAYEPTRKKADMSWDKTRR